jgi:hypothetical protein
MKEITVRVHEIAIDGLPDMDALTGRVAFVFDGCIVSGWPLGQPGWHEGRWEADSDVGHGRPFSDVTHWLELPAPAYELEKSS